MFRKLSRRMGTRTDWTTSPSMRTNDRRIGETRKQDTGMSRWQGLHFLPHREGLHSRIEISTTTGLPGRRRKIQKNYEDI